MTARILGSIAAIIALTACYPTQAPLIAPAQLPNQVPNADVINKNMMTCYDGLNNLRTTAYKDRKKGSILGQVSGLVTLGGATVAGVANDQTTQISGAVVAFAAGAVTILKEALGAKGIEDTQERASLARESYIKVTTLAVAYQSALRDLATEKAKTVPPELEVPGKEAEKRAWLQEQYVAIQSLTALANAAAKDLDTGIAACTQTLRLH
jgi:hypothetical protein